MRAFFVGRVRSLGCALAGVVWVVRSQRNAWIHLGVSVGVVLAGIWWRLVVGEWLWVICAMGMVWVAEAMNTAIELVADAAVPGRNALIGKAKDVAAGGVLIAVVCAVGIGVGVAVGHESRVGSGIVVIRP